MVEDDVSVWIRGTFRVLLYNPFRSGMSGDVAVQNLPPAMLDDEEAVDQLKFQGRHSEEVECRDRFAMIGEKCLPSLIRLPV
jgi:hypothetical protein